MARNVVHVVGTGTIGEPLIGLLAKHRAEFGIDEVTFYKHSPRATDRPMVKALQKLGAKLAVADDKRAEFEKIGLKPDYSWNDALKAAKVVLDCTPEDSGLENKANLYEHLNDGTRVFAAQGSEDGFGVKYALGINDRGVNFESNKFIHVVSCNTHNISVLIKALAFNGETNNLTEGRFIAIRRAGDVGDTKFIQAPQVDKHKEALGTHHATDVADLYQTTLGQNLNIFSSAMKLNTPYMHTIHFNIRVKEPTTKEEVKNRIKGWKFLGYTEKTSTNEVFSFAREHGPFGRILAQGVVCMPSLNVSADGKEIVGFCFTPQDGNVLATNVAVALRALHPQDWEKRMTALDPYYVKEY
ncbi:MAG TPA: hypothetical protein VNZ52_13115 [Candidatus Thermoplasmatota archaeon]|nr:hypothetical protein [Candidatus Thermoplasmatota archaeon]